MYKHIIFDFDGTLVDSTAEIMMIYNELAMKYNFKQVNQEEFNLLNNLPIKERFKALNVPMYRFLLIRKIGKEFKERYKQYLNEIHFIAEMKEVVGLLQSKGYIISVVTSNAAANVTEFLQIQGLKGFHDVRSSNGLFGKHQTLKQYMKENRLNREDILYIGDERRDILACKKCNIDVIAVTWGLDTMDSLLAEKPNYLVKQPQEIMEILTR
ncbi:phosphoglycolate phosphatase [Paenibacillus baekrokdamisoli]|uniref:Phosphoglycolate phosphatase n=1 Tax=Paenibacillus baekrokdamisoli TaxID=1712516 RepID=A0A3G9J879_9BACL|nr:HAD-IA family hydrolase [Paenibacillus baekrokdamisoli]MBB3072925.1 phosphoglycolate phosphatase [Paenibacillus baekrokdamisoli]BBH22001.1 phosphoglycolate phosphatase [Paenibacillus baekrokdamisoli]